MSDLGIDTTGLTYGTYQVGAAQATNPILSLLQTPNPTSTAGLGSTTGDNSTGPAASLNISGPAQLLSKLQQLQQQNPAEYQQILTNVSDQLQTAAQSSSGQEQQFLTSLASKFQQAANGNLSALQPPQQSANGLQAAYGQNGTSNPLQSATSTQQGQHHHHHHAASSSSSSTQQTLSSIFDELNSALSGISTSATSTSTSPTAALLAATTATQPVSI